MSSKQSDRHIIWSDIHLDFNDWRGDLAQQYPDLSEDELIQKMYEINADYLTDERANLNIQLSQPIIVIGDIGRWNGRVSGYKVIESGNIKDCLYSETDYTNGMWISTEISAPMPFITTVLITTSTVYSKAPPQKVRLRIGKIKYITARLHEPI